MPIINTISGLTQQAMKVCYTYGDTLDDNETLVAGISSSEFPDDFPVPCTWGKCARDNVCPCKIKSIGCCQFCKCAKSEFKKKICD